MSPTAPPHEKLLPLEINESATEKNKSPTITYRRFLVREKTFLVKSQFTPAIKKKEHIKKEARPKPL
jgi:hypothetical protein